VDEACRLIAKPNDYSGHSGGSGILAACAVMTAQRVSMALLLDDVPGARSPSSLLMQRLPARKLVVTRQVSRAHRRHSAALILPSLHHKTLNILYLVMSTFEVTDLLFGLTIEIPSGIATEAYLYLQARPHRLAPRQERPP
jgi:hypothetical protein